MVKGPAPVRRLQDRAERDDLVGRRRKSLHQLQRHRIGLLRWRQLRSGLRVRSPADANQKRGCKKLSDHAGRSLVREARSPRRRELSDQWPRIRDVSGGRLFLQRDVSGRLRRHTMLQKSVLRAGPRQGIQAAMERPDHILIVDDDRDLRELIAHTWRRTAFASPRSRRPAHARRAWQRPVDLIILDLMLPGEDGLVLCRDLRAGGHEATPILMLTARGDEADRIVGLEMGADDYLSQAVRAARTAGAHPRRAAAHAHAAAEPARQRAGARADASATGSSTRWRATCSMPPAPWSRSAARSTACCACSSTIRSAC